MLRQPRIRPIPAVALAAVVAEVASADGLTSGLHVRVLMESIYLNRSQRRYEPETPVLGRRYADAPALAARYPAQSEGLMRTSTVPGVNLNDFDPHKHARDHHPLGGGDTAA